MLLHVLYIWPHGPMVKALDYDFVCNQEIPGSTPGVVVFLLYFWQSINIYHLLGAVVISEKMVIWVI